MNIINDQDIIHIKSFYSEGQKIKEPNIFFSVASEKSLPVRLDLKKQKTQFFTWYHICECIERIKLASFYKEDKKCAADSGGFIGVFQSNFHNYYSRPANSTEWLKLNCIPPAFLFDESTAYNIILIRLPRELRRNLYDEVCGDNWLFHFLKKFPTKATKVMEQKINNHKTNSASIIDEDDDDVLMKIQEIEQCEQIPLPINMKLMLRNSYIVLGSRGNRKPKIEQRLKVKIRTQRKNDQNILFAAAVQNKLKSGAFQNQFQRLQDHIENISDEQLEKLTIYDVQGVEKFYVNDLQVLCTNNELPSSS